MSLKYEPASEPLHIVTDNTFLRAGGALEGAYLAALQQLVVQGALRTLPPEVPSPPTILFFLLLSSLELSDTKVYEP